MSDRPATPVIKIWPSQLGADARVGSLRLSLWKHGGVTRVVPDPGALCGQTGTHYRKLDPPADWTAQAAQAALLWKRDRTGWQPCE